MAKTVRIHAFAGPEIFGIGGSIVAVASTPTGFEPGVHRQRPPGALR